MQDVTRFTTEYIPIEDRMRVALEGEGGRVRLVWLTRRLLLRLLPRLLEVFGPPETGTVEHSVARHQARQGFNQQAAVSAIQRQKPVRAATPDVPRDPDILVWGVDINKEPKQVTLVFKSESATNMQSVPFSPAALRQWLSVMHTQFIKAGWRVDFWPVWIAAPETRAGASKLN
jgi:hypothetical protein